MNSVNLTAAWLTSVLSAQKNPLNAPIPSSRRPSALADHAHLRKWSFLAFWGVGHFPYPPATQTGRRTSGRRWLRLQGHALSVWALHRPHAAEKTARRRTDDYRRFTSKRHRKGKRLVLVRPVNGCIWVSWHGAATSGAQTNASPPSRPSAGPGQTIFGISEGLLPV